MSRELEMSALDPKTVSIPGSGFLGRGSTTLSVLVAGLVLASCDKSTNVQPTTPGDTAASAGTPTLDWVNADPWDSGTYEQPVHVYLTTATSGAEIHYTLDGSYPTASSPKSGGSGVYIDSTRTLNAIATRSDLTNSALFRKVVRILPRHAVLDSTSAWPWTTDIYDQSLTLWLSSKTPNSVVHYTLDGSAPDRNSPIFPIAGLQIDSSRYLRTVVTLGKTFSIDSNFSQSFTLRVQGVLIHTAADPNQIYPVDLVDRWAPYRIGMVSPTRGTVIRYTTNGQPPTADSPVYRDSLLFDKYADTIVYFAGAFDTANPRILPSSVSGILCWSSTPWSKAFSYGTLIDSRDGRSYRTIRIGAQNWMAENLDFNASGSRCYGDDTLQCLRLGRLYSWPSAMGPVPYDDTSSSDGHQGVCPAGWHVPRNAEWQELVDTTGHAYGVGSQLEATSMWSGATGTDAFGFGAMPSGSFLDGTYAGLGSQANFLTASGTSESSAAYWEFFTAGYGESYALSEVNFSLGGYSLRCLQNSP